MIVEDTDLYFTNHFRQNPPDLHEVRLLIIDGNEKTRGKKAKQLKEHLDKFLSNENSVTKYKIEIYDCKDPRVEDKLSSDVEEFSGNRHVYFSKLRDDMLNGSIFLPIFHNADNVIANTFSAMFDNAYPSIFTVSELGYKNLVKANYSKAECYDTIK